MIAYLGMLVVLSEEKVARCLYPTLLYLAPSRLGHSIISAVCLLFFFCSVFSFWYLDVYFLPFSSLVIAHFRIDT